MKKVLVTLHDSVDAALSNEKNKSALIDALLAQHYHIELPTNTPEGQARHLALDGLISAATSDTTNVAQVPVEPVVTTESAAVDTPTPAPEPTTTPTDSSPFEVIQKVIGDEPQFETSPTQPVASQAPTAVAEAEYETYVPGTKVCPTCGQPKVGEVCLNCL